MKSLVKATKLRGLITYTLIIAFITSFYFSSAVVGHADPFSETKEKMSNISDEEKKVLQDLFLLIQEIEEAERMEEEIIKEIDVISKAIKVMEKMIDLEESTYDKNLSTLKEVLRSYQRSGPGTFIQIILDSENLTMLIRRLNALRDLTRNTGKLLELLSESKDKLAFEKMNLNEKLMVMEGKQEELRLSIDKKIELRNNMEEYLDSLQEEREYFQEQLASIQNAWDELKILLSETTKVFSNIIQSENLPEDAIKVTFSLFSIRGTISEDIFNGIISENSLLPKMEITFETDKMTIEMPDQNLILIGQLVIIDGNILMFDVGEGSFLGMPLEPASIEDLFKEGYIVLDLKPLLEGAAITSIKIQDGYLELRIIPKLF